jgi:hypothetical protein
MIGTVKGGKAATTMVIKLNSVGYGNNQDSSDEDSILQIY